MAAIKLRVPNGVALTNAELDANFTNILNALGANGSTTVPTQTGTGGPVLSISPTLVTPILGTPTSGTLTNCTGLPVATGIANLGTGVATFLTTPSSLNLKTVVTDETGSGLLVFNTSPTFVTPILGTPTSGTLTNCTGLPNAGLVNSTISGVALGSNLNTLTMSVSGTGLSGSATYNGSAISTFTVTSNATNTNTVSTIVARDASGNFSAGTITAGLSGNASTASTLQTARNIQGVSFNGSADITVVTAGTGITVTGTAVSIPQAVATTSTVQFGKIGVGVSPTALLHLTAGTATASTAPLKFTTGTNLTAIEAGAIEYDGDAFYASRNASFRGAILPSIYTSGNSPGTGSTIAANSPIVLFPTGSNTITLPVGTYIFEVVFRCTTTATVANILNFSIISGNGTAAGTSSFQSIGTLVANGAATAVFTDNTSASVFYPCQVTTSAASNRTLYIKGTLRITTAGTLIPSIQFSGNAGTLTTNQDNYIIIQPVSTNNSAATSVGGWA